MRTFSSIWTPGLSPLAEFGREIDRALDENLYRSWQPACAVHEGKDHYLLALEVPGVNKEQLQIEAVEQQLKISGERRPPKFPDEQSSYSEIRFGRFERVFGLPVNADTGKIEAQFRDGLLQVYIPKATSALPRKIEISSGSKGDVFEKLSVDSGKKNSSSKEGERVA